MPTENRSSNTEMVSVPRVHKLKILPQPFNDLLSGAKTGEVRDCRDREFNVGDSVCLVEISGLGIEHAPTGRTMCRTITHIQTGFGLPDNLFVLSYGKPAQQHQGEPVALPERMPDLSVVLEEHYDPFMKGQVLGWNACLDKISMLGPLYTHPVQGEPVAPVLIEVKDSCVYLRSEALPPGKYQLYTHADPAEVERLRAEIEEWNRIFDMQEGKIDTLRTKLAEAQALLRDALACHGTLLMTDPPQGPWKTRRIAERIGAHLSASAEPSKPQLVECDACPRSGGCVDTCMKAPASAEPSAPVEIDERAEFESAWSHRRAELKIKPRGNEFYRIQPNDLYRWHNVQDSWEMWQARAALARKP